MMKTIKRSLTVLFLCLTVLMAALPAAAQPQQGSITLSLTDQQKQPCPNLEVFLCQVAAMENNSYYPTAPFADSGLDLALLINSNNASHAQDLCRFIQKHDVACKTAISDSQGNASFPALEKGIYLIFCRAEEGYTFNPYVVFLPQTINGSLIYDVQSEPKVENVPPPKPPAPTPMPKPDPDTGDRSNPTLWLTLLGLSGAGLILLISLKKHHKE